MFTYHEDEQTTKMAIERATIADLDFNLAKGSAGSVLKKSNDGKKLLGKEEAVSFKVKLEFWGICVLMKVQADLRGLGAFMFDDLCKWWSSIWKGKLTECTQHQRRSRRRRRLPSSASSARAGSPTRTATTN